MSALIITTISLLTLSLLSTLILTISIKLLAPAIFEAFLTYHNVLRLNIDTQKEQDRAALWAEQAHKLTEGRQFYYYYPEDRPPLQPIEPKPALKSSVEVEEPKKYKEINQ